MGIFGPSREEIWRQLSAEAGGRYEDRFWKGDKVEVSHGQWTLTLDTYAFSNVVYTRMRTPYVNADGFRFTVYRKGFFSNLGKWLGMQDVEVGHPEFDDRFIIKGNNDAKLRALFASARLRELIAAQPEIHFAVQDSDGWFGPMFPEGVDELSFRELGVIKDLERLKRLYDLFAETLDQLCRIGSADESRPAISL